MAPFSYSILQCLSVFYHLCRRTVLRELYCRHYFFQSEYRGQKIAPVGYVENQQQGEEESTFHERLATCTARLTKELEAEDCVYVLHSGDLICPAGGELSKYAVFVSFRNDVSLCYVYVRL